MQPTFVEYGPTYGFKIADIAAGENHVLILTTESTLYTFGCRDNNQLGRRYSKRHAANSLILVPEKLISSRIRKIFAGEFHNFAVDSDGVIYAWGQNMKGQCGTRLTYDYLPPTKVEFFKDLPKIKHVAAGHSHSLVLLENGDVYSFGRADYGQLGIGKLPKELKVTTPTHIDSLVSCEWIAAGDYHSMAFSKKDVFTWGFGETFALGNKSGTDELTPFKLDLCRTWK